MPNHALILALTLLALTGCSDAMCDPNPVGDAWKPHAQLLPDDAVVCGPNRKSARKPSDIVDDYPPNHVFVFYKDTTAPAAFQKTLAKFAANGWQRTDKPSADEGDGDFHSAVVSNGPEAIMFTVNRNDWGVQGSFDLNPTGK